MNTHSQGFFNKITPSNRVSLFTGEIIGSKFNKSQNMLMTSCRQKVTRQGKMCGFSTTIIEISAFAIFRRYENFSNRNWYHKATAPISTVLITLCPMSWRKVMKLIQNEIIKISRPLAFKWVITCPNWTTGTTKP